jgi:lysophospholipase L1-like esterase
MRRLFVLLLLLVIPSVSEGPGRAARQARSSSRHPGPGSLAHARDDIRNVVVIGDSLAHGAGDETGQGISGALAAMTHARVRNLGINGARTANVMRHLQRADVRAEVRRAQLIIVSVGGNDLFGSSLERVRSLLAPRLASYFVASRVRRVIAHLRHENPSAQIVLLGLYNPYRMAILDTEIARWDGGIITLFARWHAVNVIRIADLLDTPASLSPIDHYHPSASGYRAIAIRIASAYAFSSP